MGASPNTNHKTQVSDPFTTLSPAEPNQFFCVATTCPNNPLIPTKRRGMSNLGWVAIVPNALFPFGLGV